MSDRLVLEIDCNGLNLLKEESDAFFDQLMEAVKTQKSAYLNLRGFDGIIKVQKVDTSGETVYVRVGGELIEASLRSSDTKILLEKNPRRYRKMLAHLRSRLEWLEEALKEKKGAKKTSVQS